MIEMAMNTIRMIRVWRAWRFIFPDFEVAFPLVLFVAIKTTPSCVPVLEIWKGY